MTDKTAPRGMSISITDREKKIIRDESVRRGLHNFSAALRVIVNEWKELTTPTLPDNGNDQEEAK